MSEVETNAVERRGKIRVYACGGAGTNIGRQIEAALSKPTATAAEVHVCYVDTSDSDVDSKMNLDKIYRIGVGGAQEEIEGSGQNRSYNAERIKEQHREILQSFAPEDLNIIISSGSGGSGSVIGPMLARALLANKESVIVFCVGATNTDTFLQNTSKTLASYDNIARKAGLPISMFYGENSPETPESAINAKFLEAVYGLSVLFSRRNRRLDRQDLINWLQYNSITSFEPQLSALSLVSENNFDPIKQLGSVITVATVAMDADQIVLPFMVEYHVGGLLTQDSDEALVRHVPFHFVISDSHLALTSQRLEGIVAEQRAAKEARVRIKAIGTNYQASDDDIVY